jgi:hypothetical protein
MTPSAPTTCEIFDPPKSGAVFDPPKSGAVFDRLAGANHISQIRRLFGGPFVWGRKKLKQNRFTFSKSLPFFSPRYPPRRTGQRGL